MKKKHKIPILATIVFAGLAVWVGLSLLGHKKAEPTGNVSNRSSLPHLTAIGPTVQTVSPSPTPDLSIYKTDPKNNLRKQYYVMSKGGKMFGRLEVKFMPKYQNTAAIAIRFFVNPTGSRNLEFEPNTVLPR